MTEPLTSADLSQLAAVGIARVEAERQLALLASPPPPARLVRPCTVGDGILRFTPARQAELEARGHAARAAGRLSKFVPASGAATRMFSALVSVRERGLAADATALDAAAAAGDEEASDALAFAAALPRLALARPLAAALGTTVAELARRAATGALEPLLASLLDPRGLAAAHLPKALLPFHADGELVLTAFEEQLVEGMAYLADERREARFHFTVPPGARARFEAVLADARDRLARSTGAPRPPATRMTVDFSEQSPATDTLALDAAGEPARGPDGRLLLRPAGHGALLANLAATGGDLVVVKNIDNVLPRARHTEVARWKLVLAGFAAELQGEGVGRDRPLRVCGVVPTTGEPGGGPFWVAGADGRATLQIVESSQVDPRSAAQQEIWRASTHFNPVDLVVALRAPGGDAFDLERFVDPAAALVTGKTEGGRPLTVLERPGLWNGAMAVWDTAFVEVPGATFAPVKTVLDLARPEHAVGG